MSFSTRHLDRTRAESFGAAAEDYDRFRPDYPRALIDDLAELGADSVLDVGCGTGKAAIALAARGCSVLGLEPDERMAKVAQRGGIPVEVGTFETWEPGQRRFDLVVSADAWHWVQPEAGARKAAEVLRPGGHIARFWSFHELDRVVLDEIEETYREIVPGLQVGGAKQKTTDGVQDPLAAKNEFIAVAQRKYEWSLTLNAAEWIGMIGTFSDHSRIPPSTRDTLFDGIRKVIENRGNTVSTTSGTFLQVARRV